MSGSFLIAILKRLHILSSSHAGSRPEYINPWSASCIHNLRKMDIGNGEKGGECLFVTDQGSKWGQRVASGMSYAHSLLNSTRRA